jgi:hypothetical protein
MRLGLVDIISFLHLLTFSAFRLRQELYIKVIKSMKQVVREAWASGSNPDCKFINGGHSVYANKSKVSTEYSQTEIVYQI